MKNDMSDLKKLVYDMIQNGNTGSFSESDTRAIKNLFRDAKMDIPESKVTEGPQVDFPLRKGREDIVDTEEIVEESLSLAGKEVEMIIKALEKYNGKRKLAAHELGISERTLYRKIKEYGIEM
jgi:transcriptional regulator with PAS, ATPase and Fis domain